MNYPQTLEYLFSKLPMFSRVGAAAYKKDLTNTLALCQVLGNPQHSIRTVHVAGTNGKGSVSHMLAAIFQSAGYRTGLYTSPHLYDFRERIKINGVMISKEQVVAFTNHLQPTIEAIEPSFFEVTVVMALDYFVKEKVDIAIIETGLGGRLDSTNIITPDLSVITNIDWDHMQLLGDSLEKIAFEKAGIIKPGVPVVLGEATPTTLPVFQQKAQAEKANLTIASEERILKHYEWKDDQLCVTVAKKGGAVLSFKLDLPGIYQTKNILTVLAAIDRLREQGWKLGEEAITKGLSSARTITGLHGRWQKIASSPAIIIDVAHNEAGILQLKEQLKQTSYTQLHLIMGVVKDKSIDSMFALLPKEASYYFTKASLPRALPEQELRSLGALVGCKGEAYPDVNKALEAARSKASPDDLIVVCGSIFLAGEVNLHEGNAL
jgi:dihydrofolate synthase/folylpolyglutamate synthase